jgi:homoserine dehydrogenase
LLGCGAVGAGVLSYLEQRPDLFQVNPVLVRHPDLHSSEGGAVFTSSLDEALADDPDLVIELLGGSEYPADIMCAALRRGSHVVTANKAAVARHYDALHACAEAGKATFSYSAAVGGGSPILETLARVRAGGGVCAIEGVMNGTANFLLSRLGEGWDFDAAVAKAQELGFAEADPAADVDGHDAADKLSILIREAFGVAVPPGRIFKQSLRDVAAGEPQAALARGEVLKQVGRCRQDPDGSIKAEVRIEALPAAHPLSAARNEENRFLVDDPAGRRRLVLGKGAGRWPSAAAVFADVMDLQRSLAKAGGVAPADQAEPAMLRMSA